MLLVVIVISIGPDATCGGSIMFMVDSCELFDECIECLRTRVCVRKQLINSDGGTREADNASLIVVNDSETVPDQCQWLWGIRDGIHCHSVFSMCICGLSESGMEHACVDVTGNKTKNVMFTTLVRLTSEAESVRMRNPQVLRCIPGKVDEHGGKQVSNSHGFPSFLNGDK